MSRELLLSTLWQNRHVSDDAIRSVVRKLRISLQDDARSPSYIKTIPLKGYMLIAPVRDAHGEAHKTLHTCRPPRRTIFAAIVLGCLALLAGLLMHDQAQEMKTTTQVKLLTTLSGSELSPDFSPALNALVFSHRSNNDDPMQLYAKSLNTQRLLRLTWDDASYFNAH